MFDDADPPDPLEPDLLTEIRALRVEIQTLLTALRVGGEVLDEHPAPAEDPDAEARACAGESLRVSVGRSPIMDAEQRRQDDARQLRDAALAGFRAEAERRERRTREVLASLHGTSAEGSAGRP